MVVPEEPLFGASCVTAADEYAEVGLGIDPPVFVLPSYVIVEVHFA